MTRKDLLNKIKMEVEAKGLIWLGKRTETFTEKLNIVFISVDLELLKNPVEALLNTYGLSGYFGLHENADTVLIGVSREMLCNANLGKIVETIPEEILGIVDPDKQSRYTSVTMWGTRVGGVDYIANNVNIVTDYEEFIVDRYKSGTLKKGNMMHLVVMYKTFANYVLADKDFVNGVKYNPYCYWNIKKMMDFFNQKMVELFNCLSQN